MKTGATQVQKKKKKSDFVVTIWFVHIDMAEEEIDRSPQKSGSAAGVGPMWSWRTLQLTV